MSEIAAAFGSGIIATLVGEHFIWPFLKERLRQRWNEEKEEIVLKRKRGRPSGSKNKPKPEEKQE